MRSPNARTHRSEARRVGQGEIAHCERMVPVRELPPGSCRRCGQGIRRSRQTRGDTEEEERNGQSRRRVHKKLMVQQSPSRLVERVDGAGRISQGLRAPQGLVVLLQLCNLVADIHPEIQVFSLITRKLDFEPHAVRQPCELVSEFSAPLSPSTHQNSEGEAEGMEPVRGSGELA